MFIQVQFEITVSVPSLRKRHRGRRLTRKANFTEVFTCVRAQSEGRGSGDRVERIGYVRRKKMKIKHDVVITDVGSIATTWICTKSFWFLRPMDELLSYSSAMREPRSLTEGT